MKHILFLNTDDRGHVFPTLAVVAELVRRGHRVTYVTGPAVAGAVRESGAEVLCYEPKTVEKNRQGTFGAVLGDGIITFLEDLAQIVEVASALAGDLPDVVVYDESLTHFGHRLARRWSRPAVRFLPIFAENEHYSAAQVAFAAEEVEPAVLSRFLGRIAVTLPRLGVDLPLATFLRQPREDLNLVLVPKAFQPAAQTFGDEFVFVGPCPGDRKFLGQWAPPPGDRPIALVSMGTNNAGSEFFGNCAKAFANTPWHVVMSLGPNVDLDELGQLPENVEAHNWVPHLAVLEHASVVVTHGGTGSVMEALHWGRPMVVVPQPACLPVADQVAALGLGRVIDAAQLTADGLRDAVVELAADSKTRARTEQMAREINAAGGAVRAADEIEAVRAG